MLSKMMAKYKVFPSLISQSVSVLGSMYVTLLNQIIKSCYFTPAQKQITHALAKRVESLLEAGERDTWASIRNLFECNSEAAVSEFLDAAVSFNLNSSEIDTKWQHLREHARNLLEMKAREAADAVRVLKRIMDRYIT